MSPFRPETKCLMVKMQFPLQCKLGSCSDMSSAQSVRGTYETALVIYLSLSKTPLFLALRSPHMPLGLTYLLPLPASFTQWADYLYIREFSSTSQGWFFVVTFCFVNGYFLQCKWQPRYNHWLWVMASRVPPFYTTWAPCSLPWWRKGQVTGGPKPVASE